MISLRLWHFGTSRDPQAESMGNVRRVSGARRASYACRLGSLEPDEFIEGQLTDYPRWSEQLSLFVARSIGAVLAHTPMEPSPGHCFRYLLDIELEGRRQSRTPFARYDNAIALAGERFFALETASLSAWGLAASALCADVLGSLELPSMPATVEPRIHEFDGVRYCRSSDLPLEAQVAFERAARGSQCPWIPNVPDAFYVQDIYAFLEGSPRFM